MTTALAPTQRLNQLRDNLNSKTWLAQIGAATRDAFTPADRRTMAQTFARIALSSIQKNPDLLRCTDGSILASIVQAVQIGLEPDNITGHAYLVPYGSICTMLPGYKGLIQLAMRSGQVKCINARAVYGNDDYDIDWGKTPPIRHRPTSSKDRGAIVATYAIAELTTGGVVTTWMWKHEIDAIRARSPAARNKSGPWFTDEEQMAIKTVVRRNSKLLPSSPKLQLAIALDEKAEGLRDDDVSMVDGDFTVTAVEDIPASVAPAAPAQPKLDGALAKVRGSIRDMHAKVGDDADKILGATGLSLDEVGLCGDESLLKAGEKALSNELMRRVNEKNKPAATATKGKGAAGKQERMAE